MYVSPHQSQDDIFYLEEHQIMILFQEKVFLKHYTIVSARMKRDGYFPVNAFFISVQTRSGTHVHLIPQIWKLFLVIPLFHQLF